MLLFGADWEAEAIKGTLPSATISAVDSTRLATLNVAELGAFWVNFSKFYKDERGMEPALEGLAIIKCYNPWVYDTRTAQLEPYAKLYVMDDFDALAFIEQLKPIR